MFGSSWCDMSVLGSQVFGQASMESCAAMKKKNIRFSEKEIPLYTERDGWEKYILGPNFYIRPSQREAYG